MRFLNKFHRIGFLGIVCLSLVACGGDGVFENTANSAQSNNSVTNELTTGEDGNSVSNTADVTNPTDIGNSVNVNNTTDVDNTANVDTTAEDNVTPDNDETPANLVSNDLGMTLSWVTPVGNNTVSGSPLITNAGLIVTGGNHADDTLPQIKAYSSSGSPEPWASYTSNSTGQFWAFNEVAGDPNGNIFAMRVVIDSDKTESIKLVTRNAAGQLLPDYNGGNWQLRTAPSIDASGSVVFVNYKNEIAVREQDGTVKVLTGINIGNIRSKPAISRANIAYFTVESADGLVGVNLTTGESSPCLGASPSWSSPAIAGNGNIIFGTQLGQIMACTESMSRAWQYPDDDKDNANKKGCNPKTNSSTTEINMSGSPVIDAADNVFIRSSNGVIYALNAEGKIRWCHDTGVSTGQYDIAATPILTADGNLIYVDENGVSILNKSNGELTARLADKDLLFALRETTATPTITPSRLLVFRAGNNLVAVQTDTSLDVGAFWPKWGADLRNSGLEP